MFIRAYRKSDWVDRVLFRYKLYQTYWRTSISGGTRDTTTVFGDLTGYLLLIGVTLT